MSAIKRPERNFYWFITEVREFRNSKQEFLFREKADEVRHTQGLQVPSTHQRADSAESSATSIYGRS